MKKTVLGVATAIAVTAATVLVAAPASAGGHHGSPAPTAGAPVTITEGLVTPLSLEIDRQRVAFVSQNFAPNAEGVPAGKLTRVARDGTVSVLAEAPPGQEITAVSSRDGYVYYAQIDGAAHTFGSMVRVPEGGGTPEPFADLYAHEAGDNPDGDVPYGFVGLAPECEAQFPPPGEMIPPARYTGLVDIHPYSSLALNNAIFVADAGANSITRVDYNGTVSTVAVLPAQAPVKLTVAQLEPYGFPACAAGVDFITEPVPTDVEIGPDGWLYVTTLPGGPEDPSLGARGSVYKVNPKSGEVKLVATGFAGATGLAVATDGAIYVTEIFGGADGAGQISVLPKRSTTPVPLTQVPNPAAIEIRSNRLFVTWNVFAGGTLSLIEVNR